MYLYMILYTLNTRLFDVFAMPFYCVPQMVGGDPAEGPEQGWLVVVFFYTLWSPGSATTRPLIEEVMPQFQSNATFLSVRADGDGMLAVSKALRVKSFPTLVFLRGGKEVHRIEGEQKMVERMAADLTAGITAEDRMCHARRRERLRRERAEALGVVESVEEQSDERGAWEWTWDQVGLTGVFLESL